MKKNTVDNIIYIIYYKFIGQLLEWLTMQPYRKYERNQLCSSDAKQSADKVQISCGFANVCGGSGQLR